LRWRDYEPVQKPLGRLSIVASYNTHLKHEKSVKTEQPRRLPVNPQLAAILQKWQQQDWPIFFGRKPNHDDLIVPSRKLNNRNVNHGLKRWHQDLERLDIRKRRQHDARRTFITLAINDGARKEILEWITHGRRGDII
ncbi:MAG: integrase, partial [Deltaproteobacteria bacterium]|nr:integrase [Deltaproteobacteria bacterium]